MASRRRQTFTASQVREFFASGSDDEGDFNCEDYDSEEQTDFDILEDVPQSPSFDSEAALSESSSSENQSTTSELPPHVSDNRDADEISQVYHEPMSVEMDPDEEPLSSDLESEGEDVIEDNDAFNAEADKLNTNIHTVFFTLWLCVLVIVISSSTSMC